jgi:hypothetical protein
LDREAVVYAVDLGPVISQGSSISGATGGRQSASRISLNVTPSATLEEIQETVAGTVSTGTLDAPVVPALQYTPGVASSAAGSIMPIWETIHHAYPKMTPAVIDQMAAILDRRPDGQGVAKALEIIERSRRSDVRNPVGYFVNAVKREAVEPSGLARSSTSTASRYGPPMRSGEIRATLEARAAAEERRYQELTGLAL